LEYRNLGNSGLRVSMVGLGCNNLGRQVDAKGTVALIDKCLELGVNFFDCADVYGTERGRAEEYLGAAVKRHRNDAIVATKVGAGMREGVERAGASRRALIPAVDACLKRLALDHIDLLQVHFPDPQTPIEETLLQFQRRGAGGGRMDGEERGPDRLHQRPEPPQRARAAHRP